MTPEVDYDRDFYAWIARNVALLRAGRVSEVDAENIAEELESMGKRDLRQLRSRSRRGHTNPTHDAYRTERGLTRCRRFAV
ncbi:DUF29 family protein [Thiocapsa rosea]|uniref:Uncharacterized protein DUF29 n=1 Tax=Thiocapsa rosea TaxID=69360 RepID=A0A495V9G7_9GAMM|nr:DUF29 family protein [Thiocapsa rosea]RKT46042.1 uncharacterized protein DUF29 [Thiocapsa rosea]